MNDGPEPGSAPPGSSAAVDTAAALSTPSSPLDLLSRAQQIAEQVRADSLREVAEARREAAHLRARTSATRAELEGSLRGRVDRRCGTR
ncbi:hypothetical protein [Knoellia subterranea]|uniref:hypothetical protein n=1 Tax=Knoellia subterranea TaxID=184882 RepID=UPI0012EC97BA|nr:hypothetical protein [Knoellia subterranea]